MDTEVYSNRIPKEAIRVVSENDRGAGKPRKWYLRVLKTSSKNEPLRLWRNRSFYPSIRSSSFRSSSFSQS